MSNVPFYLIRKSSSFSLTKNPWSRERCSREATRAPDIPVFFTFLFSIRSIFSDVCYLHFLVISLVSP